RRRRSGRQAGGCVDPLRPARVPRAPPRFARVRSAGALVALACVFAACGGSHTAKPQKVPGEPGYWLKVHGHRMYYECAGHGSPRPGEGRIRRELRTFLRHAPSNAEDIDVRASFAEARSAGTIGDKPLVVITAGRENDPLLPPQLKRLLDDTWLSLQDELTRL